MLLTGAPQIDAEMAFARACRARWRATLLGWLRGRVSGRHLRIFSARGGPRPPVRRDVPVSAIAGTVEPSRARMFDRCFRPEKTVRERWQRIWLAEHRGERLPPINVVRVPGAYAVRDGHHRVSVARARGATTIDAVVE